MRNSIFIVIFGLIVILFALLNYYIGLRGWQTIGTCFRLNRSLYWVLFWCLTFTYIVARIIENFLPAGLSRGLVLVGSNWLGLMYYFILTIALVDLVRLIGKFTGVIPKTIFDNPLAPPITGIAVLLLVGGVWGFGLWNAYHPRLTHYDIRIDKPAAEIKKLHVVMISDVHLGALVGSDRLEDMVGRINSMKPDIVLFTGDTIDEDINYFKEKNMGSHFKKIKSKYGVFAVLGNHEYIGRYADEAVRELEKSGVKVLKDSFVKVADSFYLVGRDDKSGARFTGYTRKSLEDIMSNVDRSLPIIVMDHQPTNLGEAQRAGVDLQVSGHTHRGQLFPNHLITRRIYENDYGYLRKDDLNVIVSSGYGTWGPPIRVGNIAEIVDIDVNLVSSN